MKQLAKRFGTSQAVLRSTLETALVTYMSKVPHDVDLQGLTVWFSSQDPSKFPQRQLTTDEKLRMLDLIQVGYDVKTAEAEVRGYAPESDSPKGVVRVRPATMTEYFTDAEIEELEQLEMTPQEALDHKYPGMFKWEDK